MPRALIDRLRQFRERHYPTHAARYRELAVRGSFHPVPEAKAAYRTPF